MVKQKAQFERFYDSDGFRKRAACVCVKNENENEVLLISSSRDKNFWIIPGGGIEESENAENAAEREVYEEAGVRGRLGRLLGVFEVFENLERKHRTNVFVMIVEKEYESWEDSIAIGRRRKWFKIEDAKAELEKHKPIQGTYLNLLKGYDSSFSMPHHLNLHHHHNHSSKQQQQQQNGQTTTDNNIIKNVDHHVLMTSTTSSNQVISTNTSKVSAP